MEKKREKKEGYKANLVSVEGEKKNDCHTCTHTTKIRMHTTIDQTHHQPHKQCKGIEGCAFNKVGERHKEEEDVEKKEK